LLRPEVALVFDPFLPYAALVMVAVRRSVRGGPILRGGIVNGSGAAGLGGWHYLGGIGARITPR
jgi:hypothetical protein